MENATAFEEIEAIKRLKARYCRYLDTKDWASSRTIFADDFLSDTADAGGKVVVGADDFVAFTRRHIGRPSQPTAHQVHAPEIQVTSPTTVQGVWALQDVVRLAPGVDLIGYGHYHETYEKTDGQWRIKASRLTRLREDLATPVFSLRICDRLKKAAARAAGRGRRQ
jgi:SnoaL-like domain